jgi:hypothetical protein
MKRQRTPEEEELRRQIIKAREELTAMGLVIDSGRRRRNPETGELEIVWVIAPGRSTRRRRQRHHALRRERR